MPSNVIGVGGRRKRVVAGRSFNEPGDRFRLVGRPILSPGDHGLTGGRPATCWRKRSISQDAAGLTRYSGYLCAPGIADGRLVLLLPE